GFALHQYDVPAAPCGLQAVNPVEDRLCAALPAKPILPVQRCAKAHRPWRLRSSVGNANGRSALVLAVLQAETSQELQRKALRLRVRRQRATSRGGRGRLARAPPTPGRRPRRVWEEVTQLQAQRRDDLLDSATSVAVDESLALVADRDGEA